MTALSFTARPSRRGSAVALGASGLAILGVLSVTSLRHSVERKLTEKASANLAGTGLNEVTIHVKGRDASITGTVVDPASAELADRLVRSTPGIRTVSSVISVLAAPSPPVPTPAGRPGMLDASLTADKLVLEGVVPTEAARDELVGRGEATFGRGQVVDHLEIAAGATAKGADLQTFGDALGALRLAGGAGAHLGWRDGRYVLDGPVADEAAKAAAGALAAKLLGNNATLTNALVSQAPSKPPPAPPVPTPAITPPVPTPAITPPVPTLAATLNERPIVFALSSAVFTPASTATLDAAAAALQAQPTVRLQVNGHTDTSGTPTFNEWLGRLRSEAVVTALVERGVDPARLVPVSMGASAPSSPTDQAQNRRIVFVALA